jgi:hypothetical protein
VSEVADVDGRANLLDTRGELKEPAEVSDTLRHHPTEEENSEYYPGSELQAAIALSLQVSPTFRS